jgi:hypothetical protein
MLFLIKLVIYATVSKSPNEGPGFFCSLAVAPHALPVRVDGGVDRTRQPPSAPASRDHHYHAHSVQCAAGSGDLAAYRAVSVSAPPRRGRRRTDRRRAVRLQAQTYMAPHIKVPQPRIDILTLTERPVKVSYAVQLQIEVLYLFFLACSGLALRCFAGVARKTA